MEHTFSGKIRVNDGYTTYAPTLRGEWTPEEIRAAFADGCDWGTEATDATYLTLSISHGHEDGPRSSEETIRVYHGAKYGDYPHQVEWK